jgi:acetyl-CoA acetyltransferase
VTEAYLLGGVRTPFARYGGSLSHLRLDDLLGLALAGPANASVLIATRSKTSSPDV